MLSQDTIQTRLLRFLASRSRFPGLCFIGVKLPRMPTQFFVTGFPETYCDTFPLPPPYPAASLSFGGRLGHTKKEEIQQALIGVGVEPTSHTSKDSRLQSISARLAYPVILLRA
jgi:hypothetical protein